MHSLITIAIATFSLAAPEPQLIEDFESGLSQWRKGDRHTLPFVLTSDRAFSGKQCAYSGPPGRARAMSMDLALPLVGQLEVRFYDDMAPRKHQIAGASAANKELLAIVCHGGSRYQVRVGRTYTTVPAKRSKGWHLFAWECDGRKTVAYIDGKEVFRNKRLDRIVKVSLGSFWDASTGWYDAVKVLRRPPSAAGPFVEAETAWRQLGPAGAAIQVVPKAGASGRAINHWDKPGHALDWALGAAKAGPATLLLKYATAHKQAARTVRFGEQKAELRVAGTGGWDKWQYAGLPVNAQAGVNLLHMTNVGGSLNLDWLALAPAGVAPKTYGPLLDQWAWAGPWLTSAMAQTRAAAQRAGIDAPKIATHPADMAALPSAEEIRTQLAEPVRQLTELRNRVLAAERPKLAGELRVRTHRPLGPETPLSRECYRRLLRYVRLTNPRFRDWPHAPGCRYHKRDLHGEQAVRQNATVALGYAVLLLGNYDERLAGVPREKIASDLNALLRYIALTHAANFLPTGDGRAWGDQWQSALWARWAGQAAWLAWDRLDEDVRLMMARLIVHEANRFNTRKPDSGEWRDTKAEENAWNSMIIALAECMFPNHPNAKLWRERTIVYMINSLTRKADRENARIFDGRPAKERISTVTLHDDYTLENHGRVHPDYLASGGLLMRSAVVYHGAGVAAPESMMYNVPETMRLVRRFTAVNGSYFYVNGQDWWPHRHDSPLTVSGFTSVLANDREAAFLERRTLAFLGRMHARFDDGRAWDPREYNYRNAEEEMIARYTELYLLHRLLGDGPEPLSQEEFLRRHTATHVYDIGGFVTHRTPQKFASFAWVNGAMGLVYPSDDTWFTSPSERGMVGRVTVAGSKDTTPKVEAHQVKKLPDGFACAARMARCEGRVEQAVAVFSLPGAPVIYLERLAARTDVDVKEVATGTAAILNEDAPGISPNRRTLWHAGGEQVILGAQRQRARTLRLTTRWANIDGKLGVVSTRGAMLYRDANAYRRSRLEEELAANHLAGPGRVAQGREISVCAVAFLPNASRDETANARLEAVSQDGVVAARLNGAVVAANLGAARAQARAFGRSMALKPLETAVFPAP